MTTIIGIPTGGGGTAPKPGTPGAPSCSSSQFANGEEADDVAINKAVLTFLVPPPIDRPFQSWRALVYTREKPGKLFYENRCVPTELNPDAAIMKRELCDPDHVPAFVVQVTEKEQFVYVEGDVCEILSTEVHIADETTDKYLGKVAKNAPNIPKLILPGAGNHAPTPSIPITKEDGDVYVVDITFKTHEVKDQDLVDKVKDIAWSHGVSF
jgi:hypothetical protein